MVHLTGNPVYDAVGSITIGGLLGCTAIFLIQQNRSLLLGKPSGILAHPEATVIALATSIHTLHRGCACTHSTMVKASCLPEPATCSCIVRLAIG